MPNLMYIYIDIHVNFSFDRLYITILESLFLSLFIIQFLRFLIKIMYIYSPIVASLGHILPLAPSLMGFRLGHHVNICNKKENDEITNDERNQNLVQFNPPIV